MADTLPDYATLMRDNPYRPRPRQPMSYTFSEWAHDSGSGSMLLLPPTDAPDQRPLYRVTVHVDLNPFLPVSYVTRIFRAGTEAGELVGEFSISLNQKRAILTMGDTTTRLSNVLFTINSSPRHWNWNLNSVNLRWDCRENLEDGSPTCICFSPDASQLAMFLPPPPDASPPLPAAELIVFPGGHDYMDDIIVSALIVERRLVVGY